MKMLIVSALVCAMVVLTRAAAPPEETPQDETESRLVKRWTACPSVWSEYGGHCYLYVPTPMSWARAERNCQSLGGNLASVHNIQEYQAIQDVIFRATHSTTLTWIGGSDAQEEHYWLWSDGTSFSYQRWCHGQPTNYGGTEHCLQMNFSDQKCWNDEICSNNFPSVCVRKRR
ncbi:ladderlectin-like [Epinephelus lanceolatus]